MKMAPPAECFAVFSENATNKIRRSIQELQRVDPIDAIKARETAWDKILSETQRQVKPGDYRVRRRLPREQTSHSSSDEAEETVDPVLGNDATAKIQPPSQDDSRDTFETGKEMLVNGEVVSIDDYLGEEWSELIHKIHWGQDHSAPLDISGQILDLYPHQVKAVHVLNQMCDGPFKGGILADAMGLGKTLSVIALLAHKKAKQAAENAARGRKKGFHLWVCAPTLHQQLAREFDSLQDPEHGPVVVFYDIKDESGAEILLRAEFDILITTYETIQAQYARSTKFRKWCVDVDSGTSKEVDKALEDGCCIPRHLILFSDLLSANQGGGINTLVLDESHYVKNSRGKRHQAIRELSYKHLIQMTGTPIPNRWHDIFGLTRLQPHSPFQNDKDFFSCFRTKSPHDVPGLGDFHKERLLRFLRPLIFARSSDIISLPPRTLTLVPFSSECDNKLVEMWYVLFLRNSGRGSSSQSRNSAPRTTKWKEIAMAYAMRAWQERAHPWLAMKVTLQGTLVERKLTPAQRKVLEEVIVDCEYVERNLDLLRHLASYGNQIFDERTRTRTSYLSASIRNRHDDSRSSTSEDTADSQSESLLSVQNMETFMKQIIEDTLQAFDNEDDSDDFDDEEATSAVIRPLWLRILSRAEEEQLKSPRVSAFLELYDSIRLEHANERILVFSRSLKFLDVISEAMKRKGITCFRFDGSMNRDDRETELADFKQCEDRGRPMLVTAAAGGTGLNIAEASVVVQLEPWWTAAEEEQAFARAWRTGQTRETRQYQIVDRSSVMEDFTVRTRDAKKDCVVSLMDELYSPA